MFDSLTVICSWSALICGPFPESLKIPTNDRYISMSDSEEDESSSMTGVAAKLAGDISTRTQRLNCTVLEFGLYREVPWYLHAFQMGLSTDACSTW